MKSDCPPRKPSAARFVVKSHPAGGKRLWDTVRECWRAPGERLAPLVEPYAQPGDDPAED